MRDIGIFGLGAIGSLLTKYLKQNKGNRCSYFSKTKKEKISIKYQGQIEHHMVSLSNQEEHDLDWLIVCLKEYQLAQALPRLQALIKDKTKVVIFQNGINISTAYTSSTNAEVVIETIIDCPVQRIGPNSFLQFKKPNIILPNTPYATEFIALFSDGAIDFEQTTIFHKRQWTKLIESSSIGSIQAYTGQPCSIFKIPQHLIDFISLVDEGIKVAKSEGIELDQDLRQKLVQKLESYPLDKSSSMLTDRLAGNKLELDAKIGVILKLAKKNKVVVETTQKIYNKLIEFS